MIKDMTPMTRLLAAAGFAALFVSVATGQSPAGPSQAVADACRAVAGVSADRCDCMGAAIDPDARGDAIVDRDALVAIWKAAIVGPGFTSGGQFTAAAAKSALDAEGLTLEDQVLAIYVKALNDVTATCRPL